MKAVRKLTKRELAAELDHIAGIVGLGPLTSPYARARAAAVARAAARALKRRPGSLASNPPDRGA